ncbi:MAG: hypothetical protein HONBIEJF_02481 [Fimbriimonadaceae bacterium]|nr:hypothetical protein [Fimbriimonadaceae bacterium]
MVLSLCAVLLTQPQSALDRLQTESKAALPLVGTPVAKGYLSATAKLPRVSSRTLYRHPKTRQWSAQAQPGFEKVELGEDFYYNTRYGTPLAYARPLEILGGLGFGSLKGKRIADFGYGNIGQLRLMAACGADTIGIDIDPLLAMFYSQPGDTGNVGTGSIELLTGRWPADRALRQKVGNLDLFISKNTLKRGYVHPARPVDERMLVNLGVNDRSFIESIFRSLKPGGWVMVYNICPAKAAPDKPYVPWADGENPFPRAEWEQAGFKTLAYDVVDTDAMRSYARAFGWDKGDGAMDLEKDFAVWFSVFRKPS